MEKKIFAQFLITIGIFFLIAGFILLNGKIFSFFGKLPGDIRIERENFSFYFPITSMLIISLLLTFILNLILRLFK